MAESDTYRREVTRLVERGWRIEEETDQRATLVKRTVGTPKAHLAIAVLTIWWLMGVPNLLYGAYKFVADVERTVVWKDPAAGERPTAEESGGAV
jgi:hypothetical protein